MPPRHTLGQPNLGPSNSNNEIFFNKRNKKHMTKGPIFRGSSQFCWGLQGIQREGRRGATRDPQTTVVDREFGSQFRCRVRTGESGLVLSAGMELCLPLELFMG